MIMSCKMDKSFHIQTNDGENAKLKTLLVITNGKSRWYEHGVFNNNILSGHVV